MWDVPIVFVAGDTATCREVTELLGSKVVTAPVKEGLDRYSAKTLGHAEACDLIEARVREALSTRDWPDPWKPASPVTFTVELAAPDHVKDFMGRPGVEVVGPRKVVARGENFWELWDKFWYRR